MDRDRIANIVGITIGTEIFVVLALMFAWMQTDWDFVWLASVVLAFLALAVPIIGALLVLLIVRRTNLRDDPSSAKRPPEAP